MNEFLIPIDFSERNQEHVYLLQQGLLALGYSIDQSEILYRVYGTSTQNAVAQYQRKTQSDPATQLFSTTINNINTELSRLYRICGYVTDDYGNPVEGVTIEIKTSPYSGYSVFTGTTVSLSNGSYRFYMPESLNMGDQSANRYDGVPFIADVFQDSQLVLTSDKFFLNDIETIVNFVSGKFKYTGITVFDALKQKLLANNLNIEYLLNINANEFANIAISSNIDTEILMKLLLCQTVNFSYALPEVIFGLLYQNVPGNMPLELFGESLKSATTTQWRDYKIELTRIILAGIVLMPQEQLSDSLIEAYKRHYINEGSVKNDNGLSKILNSVNSMRPEVAYYYPILEGNVTMQELIGITNTSEALLTPSQRIQVALLFLDNINDFNAFITALNEMTLDDADIKSQLVILFRISRLVRNHLPMVAYLFGFIPSYGIEQMTTYTYQMWIDAITTGKKFPADIPGETEAEQIANYATLIYNSVHQVYPEMTALSELEKSSQDARDIKALVKEHPGFSMLTGTAKDLGITDPALTNTFNSIKSAMIISPSPESAVTLIDRGLTNPEKIYYMGKENLQQTLKDSLSQTEINNVFNAATARYSNAMEAFANISNAFHQTDPAALSLAGLNAEIIADLKTEFPNIEELFGDNDYCECNYDCSVYSASAYLADLLTFLDERKASPTGSRYIKYYLDQRRPDISKIYLNAQNTYAILPYIDLVCEILEEMVLKIERKAFSRTDIKDYQTNLTTKELLAAPERILQDTYGGTTVTAYGILSESIYPMYAPLNLWQTEIRDFLKDRGILRYEIMKICKPYNSLANLEIAAEFFRLTNMEKNVVIGSTPTQANRNKAWRDGKWENTNVPDVKKVLVTYFMEDSRLNAKQVLDIVKATWPGVKNYNITTDCTLKNESIEGSAVKFDRTHRFIRIWQNSTWKIWELDLLLRNNRISNFSSTSTDNLNADTLYNLMLVKEQQDKLNISVENILCLYGNMSSQKYYEDGKCYNSLFERLYLGKPIPETLRIKFESIKNGGSYKYDDSDKEFNSLVYGGAALTEMSFINLLSPVNNDTDINLSAISGLYRYSILSKKLNTSPERLHRIVKMLPESVSKNITDPFDVETVDEIIKIAAGVKISGFLPAELEFLTLYGDSSTNISEDAGKYILTTQEINKYISIIRNPDPEIIEIRVPVNSDLFKETYTNNYRANDAYKSYFINALSSIGRFNNINDINELIRIIELPPSGEDADRNEQIDEFIGYFLPDALGYHYDSSSLYPKESGNVSQADIISRYTSVINYINLISKMLGLRDGIAKVFDIPSPVADLIITYNLYDSLDDPEASKTELQRDIRLLHKITFTVKKLYLTVENFGILLRLQNKIGFLWSEFKAIDTDNTQTIINITQLLDIETFLSFNNELGANSKEETLLQVINSNYGEDIQTPVFKDILVYLYDIFGWAESDITAALSILKFLESDMYKSDTYSKISNLINLANNTGLGFNTLLNVSRRDDHIIEEDGTRVTITEYKRSIEIHNTIKSQYSDEDWLDYLPALQKPIRETKENALAEYMIGWSRRQASIAWNDRKDLYSYFLLDTEMSACMKISRIVLATSSVHLFVQRSMLNLEPNVIIDEDFDAEWKQWEWMKKYRLWEANRKIFLYPENWIEPELRDDKTNFFKELEEELSQSEITNDNVETAFESYLQKLNEVANLSICSCYREFVRNDDGLTMPNSLNVATSQVDTLHVVARTKSSPYQYYYRNYNALNQIWSNWEKIDLDIGESVVVPVVYNRRLHLFWLSAIGKAMERKRYKKEQNPNNETIETEETIAPLSYTEIQLCWSVQKNKKWSAVNCSQRKHIQYDHFPISTFSLNVDYNSSNNELLLNIYNSFNKNYLENKTNECLQTGMFYFDGDVYRSISLMNNFEGFTEGNYNNTNTFGLSGSISEFYSLNKDDYSKFSKISLDMGMDEKPEMLIVKRISDEDTLPNKFIAKNGIMMTSRHYFLPVYNVNEKTELRLHDYKTYKYKVVLKTDNKDPNFIFMIHNYKAMRASIIFHYYFNPFFYQDSERVFFVNTEGYNPSTWEGAKYRFEPHYHAYTKLFIKELNRLGIKGLLNRNIQTSPQNFSPQNTYNFYNEYNPPASGGAYAAIEKDIVDFSLLGPYSVYNWELFFHVPLYIATKLSQNQKFEQAMEWFHYIFNPVSKTSEESPQKYWVTKPFYELSTKENREQQIRNILTNAKDHASAVNEWLNNPYKPHLVARTRMVAYQRTVVMKYIDNLIAWADRLFRQDSIESNNEATLLYIIAYEILGKRPLMIPNDTCETSCDNDINYEQIKNNANSSSFLVNFYGTVSYNYESNHALLSTSNPLISVPAENVQVSNYANSLNLSAVQLSVPRTRAVGNTSLQTLSPSFAAPVSNYPAQNMADANFVPVQNRNVYIPHIDKPEITPIPRLDAVNFCIPANDMLLGYWDLVEDRLFKLRNCLNIEGVYRELPLFEPPIDPAMLVKAASAGLSPGDALNEMNSRQPYYRFRVIVQKAIEYTNEVKQLGDKLLSVLEKKDSEALSILRSTQEVNIQQAMKQVRNLQINEAKQNIESLQQSINTIEARAEYYSSREYMNGLEIASTVLSASAAVIDGIVAIGKATSGGFAAIPDIFVGGAGAFGSPFFNSHVSGGEKISDSTNKVFEGLAIGGRILDRAASLTATQGQYVRRKDDWDFQAEQAKSEIEQLEKQIVAAEIRQMIAEKELENMQMQIEQSKSVLEYYKSKYTNEALYSWMLSKVSSVYFQAYEMAYDMAKKAEMCYKKELGIYSTTNFIKFDNWDSLRKGLLTGEKLINDLHRLESAYYSENKRTHELTKHISLAQMFPDKLITLLTNPDISSVDIDLKEFMFDMDYPGHYKRRIKSVSITIPNVAGPFQTVSCMLGLLSAKVRTVPTGSSYAEDTNGDPRFNYQTGGSESICTSSAQNDSGMFEFNFNDERYLPFENAGAISIWQISLPAGTNQFDRSTISDIILHINYTAEYDGALAVLAKADLTSKLPSAGVILLNPKQDYSDAWNSAASSNPQISFVLGVENLPFFLRGISAIRVIKATVLVASKINKSSLTVTINSNTSANAVKYASNGNVYLYKMERTFDLTVSRTWTVKLNGITKTEIEDIVVAFTLTK